MLAQGTSIFIRLLGMVVLARLLPPSLFGLVAVVGAIGAFSSNIINLGLPMATLQARTISLRATSTLLYINATLGLLLGLLMFVSAHRVADFYGAPDLVIMMQVFAVVPLISGVQSQFRLHLIRRLKFTYLAISDVLAQIVATLTAITLAFSGYGISAVLSLSVVFVGVQGAASVLAAGLIPGMPGNWKSEVKGLLLVGLRVFGTTVLRDGSRNILMPIMALAVTPSALGNYDRAHQIAVMPINATVDQLQKVAVPVLSRLKGVPDRMTQYVLRSQAVLTYSTATGFAVVAALAPKLIFTVLGPDWELAGHVLRILSVGAIFRTLGQSTQWVFIASGNTSSALKFSLWSQPAIILFTLAGLPWGVYGVATGNAVAWLVYWPVATLVSGRAAGLDAKLILFSALRGIMLFALPVGGAASISNLSEFPPLLSLLLGIVLATVAGLLLIVLIRPVRREVKGVAEVARLAVRRS